MSVVGRTARFELDSGTQLFNFYRVAEAHRAKHGAFLIFDVDPVMKHHAALVFRRFSERDAGLSNGMHSSCVEVRKLNTLVIGGIDVVVQMKEKRGTARKRLMARRVPRSNLCKAHNVRLGRKRTLRRVPLYTWSGLVPSPVF